MGIVADMKSVSSYGICPVPSYAMVMVLSAYFPNGQMQASEHQSLFRLYVEHLPNSIYNYFGMNE